MAGAAMPVSAIPAGAGHKVRRTETPKVPCSFFCCSSSSTATISTPETRKFSYSRASPSVRWPHLKLADTQLPARSPPITHPADGAASSDSSKFEGREETQKADGPATRPRRLKARKMSKLELKRARDWRERVRLLADRILGLKPDEFVADVLDDRPVQMTPTDFCFVVKWVGQKSWQRALEVYEWLNLRHWYSPSARMLATILSVLGRANQEALAIEIFTRAEPGTENTVQVYNAMMGVYARNGWFNKVQELLDLMRTRGCEPDLVSFNTLIHARAKSGFKVPDLAIELLDEVRRSGVRPDIITYNTLISACSRESALEVAEKVYHDMEMHGCQPDLWTYNAMISVYGRCGRPSKAEELLTELDSRGFVPDAVTYNSLLYAFARAGNLKKVKEICEEMEVMGFSKDEMTYNTIIHMYGKQGQHDVAREIYKRMKSLGRNPDAVTYAVLIDVLGKENMMMEAEAFMSEMLDAGVKPTLQTFSALISGYVKAGMKAEAEETYNRMLRSGIRPDHLAYSVMLDAFLRFNDAKKALVLYFDMVRAGFTPDLGMYEVLLRVLAMENKGEDVARVVDDMKQFCKMSPQMLSSFLVKCNCHDHAVDILRLAITQGLEPDCETLLTILSAYSSSGRLSEAAKLFSFLKERYSGNQELVTAAQILMLCKAKQLVAALTEYREHVFSGFPRDCVTMFETLIKCCEEAQLFAEASQVFCDMTFYGIELSQDVYLCIVGVYCKLIFPETAHFVLNQAQQKGFLVDNISIYVSLIEAYGNLKLWNKAENLVKEIRQNSMAVDLKIWNALLQAYAAGGCYERARAAFNIMTKNGPLPTVDSFNCLLQALIVEGRLGELYSVIQEFQDMGFKISKSSILLMLDAFAQVGDILEVKKIYHGMKAAGYFPTMHQYRLMLGLFSSRKRVTDAETIVAEMEEMGFKPDMSIWNFMLKMYTRIGDFKKAFQVYSRTCKDGLQPDEDFYNTLILVHSRDLRPEEGLLIVHEMKKLGMDPKLSTYKSLISACGKKELWEQAEELFKELQSRESKLDRSFYHIMMKIYRNSGNHCKAENLLVMMKERSVQPTTATMHLLMVSYGMSGQPEDAEKVLSNLKESDSTIGTLPYSSVIDAYLKKMDYNTGIQKLMEMQKDGLEPDHRIWTCFIRAASVSQHTGEAIFLLTALGDAGFDLPIRLLTEKSDSLIGEVDHCLEKLKPVEDNAAFNLVNSLADLLWAFELRSTASWLFQLAIKRSIYRHDVFRVTDKDWGADFRRLSAGSALVGLTLWLDHMQDASLQGVPESPKSVVLITGTAEYNMVSLNSTLKASLWEMGSPFFPCKTRSGVLVAKAHSLRMWLKDSPFCLDLELKDAPSLPEVNSMQLIDGCFMRRGLVPAFMDITERLGQVRAKKFARLALLSDEKRDKAIQSDVEGAKEKLDKMNKRNGLTQTGRRVKLGKTKFIQKVASRH